MQTKMRGIGSSGAEEDVKVTDDGAVYSTNQQRIWTAKGYGWQAMATSAVASLIVRPTTTAIISFYNNTSNKYFVIEKVFSHALVSIADGNFGIWLCVHPVGAIAVDTPTNDITPRNSTSGLTAGTEGTFDIEATVVDDGWFPWGESATTVTTTVPGSLAQALVEGRIILPPTAAISASVVGQTAVITNCMGLHYYSVPLDELDVN